MSRNATGLLPVVVVPVLNEQDSLEATCLSLGFGCMNATANALLILVDNGSTDGTVDVAASIRDASEPGAVLVVREPERGFVPARSSGVRAAAGRARHLGWAPEQTLVLQADADTIYADGYVAAMVEAALAAGTGHLFEGASIPPPREIDPCLRFRELEALVDSDFPMAPEELDVVVDDKVSAYHLADYDAWGGHVRERLSHSAHDELLAETTRLYMRARYVSGARRIRVDDASATTSSRRIVEDPAMAFATAGFPREAGWCSRWQAAYAGPRALSAFTPSSAPELRDVIGMRVRHLSALFQHLPEQMTLAVDRARRAEGKSSQVPPASAAVPRMISDAFQAAGIA